MYELKTKCFREKEGVQEQIERFLQERQNTVKHVETRFNETLTSAVLVYKQKRFIPNLYRKRKARGLA